MFSAWSSCNISWFKISDYISSISNPRFSLSSFIIIKISSSRVIIESIISVYVVYKLSIFAYSSTIVTYKLSIFAYSSSIVDYKLSIFAYSSSIVDYK